MSNNPNFQYGSSYRSRPRANSKSGNRAGTNGYGNAYARGGGGGGTGGGRGVGGGDGGDGGGGGGGGGGGRRNMDDYDPYGEGYGSGNERQNNTPPPSQSQSQPRSSERQPPAVRNASNRLQRMQETNATRQIGQVLEHIKSEWPSMCENECVPVQMALQLLDTSSVGRAHEYRKFQQTHAYLQDSLKNIVHEHHQGFNSSIGTYHKIQSSIQASQKKVRTLKDSLAVSKTNLCTTDTELKKQYNSSEMYDALVQTLDELEELCMVPDQLEARISEKRFLNAVDVLQTALRKLRRSELDNIGALTDLRSYLVNQEGALMDILVEELHDHLYLKSPYCQDRWGSLAKANKHNQDEHVNPVVPFQKLMDGLDLEQEASEDPSKNPEADTFHYIGLLVEALNRLGRLESAVDTLKQRLPVELFAVVNDTVLEVDQQHPSSMRGSCNRSRGSLALPGSRETQMKKTVIDDLLGTLYAKFEAIAEGHRVFHEAIKALIRREGAGNNSALLGTFKEVWNLYQNELRTLLHNYVTTDADVYQYSSAYLDAGAGGMGGAKRDNLFKFGEADPKAPAMVTEYEALDDIIEAAVPGLTSTSRSLQGGDGGKGKGMGSGRTADSSRRSALPGAYGGQQNSGSLKSLVEPSVFNMSLLLPGTLGFLQRLKNIVPPGSDLATSTLTSFLDNILVNVFQPQVDETLAKYSDDVFGLAESFLPYAQWRQHAKKPIFHGTYKFFDVIIHFCRMLGTIPHDQALSTLVLTQLNGYYERCSEWYKSHASLPSDRATLKYSARLANEPGEIRDVMLKLLQADGSARTVEAIVEKEIEFFINHASGMLVREEDIMKNQDPVKDRETIESLCLLYTSMKWLSAKVLGLRYITKNDTDSNRQSKPASKRWTLLNEASGDAKGPVYLPMTMETVQSFDSIVSSYQDLATTVLLTLHSEVRCRVVYSLRTVLSAETAAPYLLDQAVSEPDPSIAQLNEDLVAYDEITSRHLRDQEIYFMRTGLGPLVKTYLVANASMASPMNAKGCGRMQLNVLVLQQNLKNIEPGVDLVRAADYFALFERGPDAIVEIAKVTGAGDGEDGGEAGGAGGDGKHEMQRKHGYSYDELKALVELCYSEQLANPERGIATAAKRQMADRLLNLSEYMWQS